MKLCHFSETPDKSRNVPNADEKDKKTEVSTNPMGHDEQTTTKSGKIKRVLNELDPDDETQLESRGLQMAKPIRETVQDHTGVSGDFMEPMGGKTDRLGGSQKNTGHAYEQCYDSSSGSPDDGVQTRMKGENLLGQSQKNIGGSFEEFGQSKSTEPNDSFQDQLSGDMASDLGQNEKQKNKGGQHETFQGNRNKMSEEWSLDNVVDIMEDEDVDLQQVFNAYAAQADLLCLEDFQQICDAYDVRTTIGENNFRTLINNNQDFMFYESDDNQGTFWIRGVIDENIGALGGIAARAAPAIAGAVGGAFGGEEEEVDECSIPEDGIPLGGEEEDEFDEDEFDESEFDESDMLCGDEDPLGIGMEGDEEFGPEMGDDDADTDWGRAKRAATEFEFGGGVARSPRRPTMGRGQVGRGQVGRGPIGRGPMGRGPMGRGPFEDALGDDNVIQESAVSTGDIAGAPFDVQVGGKKPMGTSIAQGTDGARNRRSMMGPKGSEEEDPKRPEEEDPEAVPGRTQKESVCPRCGHLLDSMGCPACDLLRETSEYGLLASGASADSDGRLTSDATKKGQGKLSESIPGAETQESAGGGENFGCCSEVSGMGKDLGQNEKMKNTGGQAQFNGGGKKMQENVMRLARVAKSAIEESAKKIGRVGKYAMRFTVTCEGVKARRRKQLTEVLVDVEELMQAYGPAGVVLEAEFYQPQGKMLGKTRIPLADIARRTPIVSENKVLFRYTEVANDFADKIVLEGLTCRVKNHNWGTSVTGKFDWTVAKQAFRNIPDNMIGEGRTSRPFAGRR